MARILGFLAASLLMGFFGALLAFQLVIRPAVAEAQAPDLRARQLVIVGSDGLDHGVFGELQAENGATGTTLRLMNAEGAPRVTLNTGFRNPDAAGVNLHDSAGLARIRAQLLTDMGGNGVGDLDRIAVLDSAGNVRINIGVDGGGTPFIEMRDAQGAVTWQAR